MAVWAKSWKKAAGRVVVLALLGCLGLAGCGKESVPSEQADKKPENAPAIASTGSNTGTPAAQPTGTETAPPRDAQHEAFDKATRGGEDPPANSNPPPDKTASGKSVYKIYKEVL